VVGGWYAIGVFLGLGLGFGLILSGVLASSVLGAGAAALVGAAIGVVVGLTFGDAPDAIAGGVGGFLGALAGAVVVYGALRRGATRLGLSAYVGALGILVCLLAFVPVLGYVVTVAVPAVAARLRGRQAARFAGLRTLAK
jgi:hypothetical protein